MPLNIQGVQGRRSERKRERERERERESAERKGYLFISFCLQAYIYMYTLYTDGIHTCPKEHKGKGRRATEDIGQERSSVRVGGMCLCAKVVYPSHLHLILQRQTHLCIPSPCR